MRFAERNEAGDRLAVRIRPLLAGMGLDADPRLQVLALPRGGVPVARPIADLLGVPLGVLTVRKLGLPRHPELAMGAIAMIGRRIETVRNDTVVDQYGIGVEEWAGVHRRETAELRRRAAAFGPWTARNPAGAPLVLVDDGLATGATMRAAVAAVRAAGAGRIVVAVPVASIAATRLVETDAVRLVVLSRPDPMIAVGEAYRDFHQLDDDEVVAVLREHDGRPA